MSWFSDLFTSPRERAAPGLYQGQMSSINSMQSPFAGINSQNVNSTYGLTPFNMSGWTSDVNKAYTPLYQNLATGAAKNRSNAAARMGAGQATPEARFAPIDSGYNSAMSQLEGQQGQQTLQGYQLQQNQQDFVANLLQSAFGNTQNFNLGKVGLQNSAINNYLGSLSDNSTFSDILNGVGTAAQVAGTFMGIPPVGLMAKGISAGGNALNKSVSSQGYYGGGG